MPHLSVVVPVYKAESCLTELYRRLRDSLTKISEDFEIILVEDCGGDRSWDIIKELAVKDRRVKGIRFTRNFGQHYGITAGLDQACGEWVVIMDCDLQDQPEEIPRLYAKAREGYPAVLARRGPRKDFFLKKMISGLFYKLFRWLSGIDYDGRVGNFRIISKEVVKNYRNMREQLRFFGGLMSWMGYNTAFVDVEHAKSKIGKSTYSYRKLFRLAGDAVIAYSDKPLRVSVQVGFLISTAAFIAGLYILWRAFFLGVPVMGWTSLIVSLYFMSGLIIFILGIIGIYLGKVFDETKGRPLFVILDRTW
ncbi:MAG: glycosyltransferase [Omnitrophica bacterium RIFCSPHIGHO2_02_FULL_51_18]|nr:MAG: glycosyltransferase [Omnitrophica bacterium RIFCSPHIGHO2_02_FULL_51_18]